MYRLTIIILIALTSLANAATYRLTNNSLAANAQPIIREADGAAIPNDPHNADYQQYLVWLAVPNTPDAAPTPPTPPTTTLQIVSTAYGTALNGTYKIDAAAQANITAMVLFTAVNSKFPATDVDPTGATIPWLDSSSAAHVFPSVAEFQAFAGAVATYVTNYALTGTAPAQPVTIP